MVAKNELSSEDALRLNVLVTNAEAIRIDESNMVVHGLAGDKEMKIPLSPTCRADKYLTLVRETLAAAVLDSPGGYPVFLRRWTRMGQIDNEQMDRLLKIGEPEAVMAVVCSPGLSDELARLAWWVAPYSENARRMLERPGIVTGKMGPILAEHLVEHLPFETEHAEMLETVRLVLQPGLIDEERRQRLWEAGRAKKTYRIGFLEATPDELPEQVEAHPLYDKLLQATGSDTTNPLAKRLLKALSGHGQSFIATAADALRRPADQDVTAALFNAVGRYLGDERYAQFRDPDAINADVDEQMRSPEAKAIVAIDTSLQEPLRAALYLGHMNEYLLNAVFAQTDAVGSLMRKKIEPITRPISEAFSILRT